MSPTPSMDNYRNGEALGDELAVPLHRVIVKETARVCHARSPEPPAHCVGFFCELSVYAVEQFKCSHGLRAAMSRNA